MAHTLRVSTGMVARVPSPTADSPPPWRATLGRSITAAARVPLRAARPAALLHARWRRTRSPSWAAMSTSTASVMLDVGGGPGHFRSAFEGAGATYVALDADVGELAGSGEISARTVARERHAAPVPRRLSRRLLLQQRPGARARALVDGPRDATGDPPAAAPSFSATRSGSDRTAAMRLPRGTTSAVATRGAGTCARTGMSPRTGTARPSSVSLSPTGCAGRARRAPGRWSTCRRATTRGGPSGCCACLSCERW